jgi:hypothetical protein
VLLGFSSWQPALAGGPHDGAPTLSPGAGTAVAGVCLLAVAAITRLERGFQDTAGAVRCPP